VTGHPPGPIAGHGERILVVEDEPAFAELIALWLERHGWRPEIAPDGAHALRAVAEQLPDLIVLDLGLPRVDGWQVIERVREESLVPIIVVTARGSEADKVRGAPAPCRRRRPRWRRSSGRGSGSTAALTRCSSPTPRST